MKKQFFAHIQNKETSTNHIEGKTSFLQAFQNSTSKENPSMLTQRKSFAYSEKYPPMHEETLVHSDSNELEASAYA